MPITLNEIVKHKQGEVTHSKKERPVVELQEHVATAKPPRNFFGAVVNGHTRGSTSVIAEIKHKSPSAGVIRNNFDPAYIATEYEKAGAAAISCLTDERFFGGDLGFIEAIRQEANLPVLRKDFIIDGYQLLEARACGADSALLIVATLTDSELRQLIRNSRALGMEPLVEVNTRDEMARAVEAGARVIGINNRDLRTFSVDLGTTNRVAEGVSADVLLAALSGISNRADVERFADAGVGAILVGEALMSADNVEAKVAELLGSAPARFFR